MNGNSKKLFLCTKLRFVFDIIFKVSFFFIISYVWAEEDVFRHPLAQETMSTFNATCANLAEKPIIKGNFVQEKYLNRFDRSLQSSGTFIITAKQGIVWETLQPFPSTMILGKDFIMQSRPDGRKSVISAQGNETFTQMAVVMSAVFSGQSQGLLDNFDVYFLGSVTNWNMGLLPRDSVFASFFIKIAISGDSAIRSIRIFEQNGDVITYTLSNPIYPTTLNDYEKTYFSIP
ncbi:MAG: outer membrane lipoprotein carrier protein LolA [Treponema sp.]|nr:outer membrane lipoprotein carrier protein LolA [Treponema sp.]